MVDIHTHIIYGIDDGARDFDESIEMIKLAVKHGTTKMVATSHYMPDTFPYTKETYKNHLNKLNQYCIEHKINMSIVPGNELFLTPENMKDLHAGKCRTYNGTDYVLVEMTNYMRAEKADELLGIIANSGKKIVLAHAERLRFVLDNMDMIHNWYELGYTFQLNGTSLLRPENRENYKSAQLLMKQGYVHYISSDGHRINRRRPKLDEAYDYVEAVLGKEAAELLFVDNPSAMLEDGPVYGLKDKELNKNYSFKKFKMKLKGVK